MDKIFTLPDLLPAPTSDLGLLVRRLVEYADWSLLPALMDELNANGRASEVRSLGRLMSYRLTPQKNLLYLPADWGWWAEQLMALFWWDLFSVEGCMAELSKVTYKPKMQVDEELRQTRATYVSRRVVTADNVYIPQQTVVNYIQEYEGDE